MRVKLTFEDKSSFTEREVVENLKSAFGKTAQVSVRPSGNSPESYIYYALQQLITPSQVESFYEDGTLLYQERLKEMRREVLSNVETILNQVIVDNEFKITDE